MRAVRRSVLAKVAVYALLVTTTLTARTLFAQGGCIGVCKGEVVGIAVGIAAGGAALGIGVYYAVHHNHSLNGCVVSDPNGLQLQSQGDGQTYSLVGEVAAIKPGDRVRVSGKREKRNSSGPQQFLVEKLSKDYGACKAASAAH